MVCTFSHDAMEVSQQDAFARVQVARLEGGCPASCVAFACLWLFPVNAADPSIQRVGRAANVSKVCNAIVRLITVDVVNHIWLFAVLKKPADSMSKVVNALMSDAQIATRLKAPSRVSNSDGAFAVGPHLPSQFAS